MTTFGCAIVACSTTSQAQAIKAEPLVASPAWYATAAIGGAWAARPSSSYSERWPLLSADDEVTVSGTTSLGGGVAVDAGLGYRFGHDFRSELTYVFTRPSLGSTSLSGQFNIVGLTIPFNGNVEAAGSLNSNSIFVSGYYDVPTKSRFRPYVGAGLGWTNISLPALMRFSGTLQLLDASADLRGAAIGGNASAFGYQAKLGISYRASPSTDVYLEGTYQGNTSVTIGGVEIGALNQFGVRTGLRYRFGG